MEFDGSNFIITFLYCLKIGTSYHFLKTIKGIIWQKDSQVCLYIRIRQWIFLKYRFWGPSERPIVWAWNIQSVFLICFWCIYPLKVIYELLGSVKEYPLSSGHGVSQCSQFFTQLGPGAPLIVRKPFRWKAACFITSRVETVVLFLFHKIKSPLWCDCSPEL